MNANRIELEPDGLDRLRCAIIESACAEYRAEYRRLKGIRDMGKKRTAETEEAWRVEELERWFHSHQFGVLCALNPDYLLERIRKEVDDG